SVRSSCHPRPHSSPLTPLPRPPTTTPFPYTTLFRSLATAERLYSAGANVVLVDLPTSDGATVAGRLGRRATFAPADIRDPEQVRSEEHTSELQSRFDLVCRLLLEKKKDIRQGLQMSL